MNITKFKKQDIYWYLFIIVLVVIPLVPFVANNSFLQHVLILILLFVSIFVQLAYAEDVDSVITEYDDAL